MSKARVLTVVVALAMGLMPILQAQAASDFSDVPSGVYYETAVDWLVQEGITTGTSATTFSPDDPVTRGQMATFLWRYDGEPATVGSGPFTDVLFGAYYFSAVLWLVQQGITTGTSATTYSPGDPVTRGQMAAFLWRYAGKPAPAGASPFTDVSSDAYYAEAVAWLVGEGITTGTSATTFSPDDPVTRGQMAAFLWRYAGEPKPTTTTTTFGGGGGGGGPAALSITSTSPLAAGTIGVAYSVTLAATGGTAPYTWTVTVGSLPASLTLDPDTGEISGTPTTAENPSFTVQVEDSLSATDTEDFTLDVSYSCAAQSAVPETECDALVALYNSTAGSSWTDDTGWLSDLDVCSWHGVTCASGHVTQLSLASNSLTGTIPSDLGDLTNLTYLRLDDNSLTGPIPPELGTLASVTDLRLDHNGLTSSVGDPIPNLDGLTSVQRLNLSFNSLAGPIPELSSSLTNLNLNDNQLSGAIPDLSGLTNLSVLNLYDNQLTSLDSGLGDLPNLTVMDVHHNLLAGSIPTTFGGNVGTTGGLAKLTTLRLYDNQLSGFESPVEIGNLTTLTTLDLANNQLDGDIPDLSTLTVLTGLFLNDNLLDGLVPDLSALTNLDRVYLYNNELSGAVPDLSSLTPSEFLVYGQTGCLTAATPQPATWLTSYDPNWNDGCVVTITTASPLPDGTTGTPYSVTLEASGGTGTYTWTSPSGPASLGSDARSGHGVISGTPDTAVNQTFTVTVTDDNGTVGTKEFTLDVVAPPRVGSPEDVDAPPRRRARRCRG